MRRRELRLALVCYGGVSLAVYMHGITKEVWKLSRASMRRHHQLPETLPPADDSEAVYGALLAALAPNLDLTVSTDIIAGASAGGINGILLAQAIATGQSMEPLRGLWLEGADSDRLLDPVGASSSWSKLWAMPLIAWTNRHGLGLGEMEEPEVRTEAAGKLSRLMRSRWFTPPFSGAMFSGMLLDAFAAMAATSPTPPLLPDQQPLDLFVTVTDYHGSAVRLALHSPAEISETEHRLILGFQSAGAGPDGARHLADAPALAFAARATASFPGAFPPAGIGEMDAVLAARGDEWPGRAAFLAGAFPRHADPEKVALIDGSVINGRPFGPAIEALGHHRAHREVDRRFVYVDPRPGMHAERAADGRSPGFFATILRSLADIPRQQPINDSLGTIEALSARVRRLRAVTEGMGPQVEAAIEAAVGRRFFLFAITPERLAEWRSKAQTEAATRAGFTYASYAQLKLARLTESLSQLLASMGAGAAEPLRVRLVAHLHEEGLDKPAQAQGKNGAGSPFVLLLRQFDIEFRIRRLRFVIRRINALAAAGLQPAAMAAVEALKAGFYSLIDIHLGRRNPARLAAHAALDGIDLTDPAAALAGLAQALDLRALDTESDRNICALFAQPMPRAVRRNLLNAYLGFPLYDIATLPLLAGDGSDEFDEIKVDRLSPLDSPSLAHVGGTKLQGSRLNAFGAFFSRAYREHDYLWGRLHAAERLIDIVASATANPPDLVPFKDAAFRAILAAEREQLPHIAELITRLEAALASSAPRSAGDGR
ncbi:patatin-related protein [Polymorphobacter multimanifer]|uniref:Patatin-related protein n=1 Tax=Polymorphobacter multimanifer TaxID=1070431 RepID=A0A841L3S0_9SPHN|nr:patatin-like protein [Polymorphobacter multimanifer]MBB6227307.1 patatin-related protein [Polymorphobacter multimanifer]